MQVRSFLLTMGAGIAVGALGAMMLPKNSEVYKTTKQAANAIKREAESAIDSLGSMQYQAAAPFWRCGGFAPRWFANGNFCGILKKIPETDVFL